MPDIKLFRPQRLTDNADGGGLATNVEVVDGQVNNLFDDISRIDRVNGELSLRKAFVIAATPDTALYSDLHLTVAAPPLDPRVSAVLFRTDNWNDERDDAKAAVERYLDESVISRMVPYDRQLQGQRTVLVFQRPELALPEIGEVYVLKNDGTGAVEFIRVQDVDHEVQTFVDPQGEFQVRVITLTNSQPLSQEFAGSQPNRYFSSSASVIRKTIASDAARYKGVVSLAQDAAAGDLSIRVDSIFAQLVPSATTEVPVLDAQPAGATALIPAANAVVTVDGVTLSDLAAHYVTSGILPGSVAITGGSAAGKDDSKGNLIQQTAEFREGPVDYARGSLTFGAFHPVVGSGTIKYTPAALVSKSALSTQIPVQVQNRGYVYVATLHPLPAPASVTVSYRAQGKWYTLEDDGTGALVGDTGAGTGLVNFTTGTVQVTLGALPDVGSSVIIAWGAGTEYEVRTGDSAIKPPAIRRTVAAGNIEPGSFSVQWTAGGVTKTATDDGAGNLTGGGTGRVVYSTGEYQLLPTLLPDPTTSYVATFDAGATLVDTFTPSISSGSVSLQASVYPLRPRSVVVEYTGTWYGVLASYTRPRRLVDNGVGQLLDESGAIVTGSSVNYTTGLVIFNPNFSAYVPDVTYDAFANPVPGRVVANDTGYYSTVEADGKWATQVDSILQTVPFINGTAVTMRYKEDAVTDGAATDTVGAQPLVIDLLPTTENAIVPGGVRFTLGGKVYYDRNGTMYHSINIGTGAGTAAGSIDYSAGTVSLTSWTGGATPALSVSALLTQVAPLPLSVIHGRTPGSPLRPGTFYIQANRYRDGALVSAVADNNGNIATSAMHGYVDVNTGVFSVGFGAWVLDSSLTVDDKAAPWYDVANVRPDGYVWRPDEVIPGTVRFNCVVQTTLPQDPAIIKVNPVRLPSDGRVPMIRAGDTLVISDTLPYTLPNPVVAGSTTTLPRSGLASVSVYDDNGLGVDPVHYVADLAAGTLTWTNPLDLSAYVQPLVALHTVEDMALCIDAQITGEVTLGAALTHGYTAGQSVCSSALILGDAQARYASLFAQNTFTGVWSDALIGSAPTGGAQYNDALWPVEVKNADAITQRWRINFTSATAYQVVGETMGVIATGTTAADCAPINPATGLPYFTLRAAGFGAGWATGNQLRFNTLAAGGPVWMARTVLSGPASNADDRVRIDVRWDKD